MEQGFPSDAVGRSARREILPPFMVQEISLPCLQDLTTGPYIQAHIYSLHLRNLRP